MFDPSRCGEIRNNHPDQVTGSYSPSKIPTAVDFRAYKDDRFFGQRALKMRGAAVSDSGVRIFLGSFSPSEEFDVQCSLSMNRTRTRIIALSTLALTCSSTPSLAQFEVGELGFQDRLGKSHLKWTTSSIDFDREYSHSPLASDEIDVSVCSDHFPSGSAARREYDQGLAYFGQVSGLKLKLTPESHGHHSIDERFGILPRRNEIQVDYAYNTGQQGYIPCHSPHSSDPALRSDEQWGFAGNSCSHSTLGWGKGGFLGKNNASRVSINPLSVVYDEDSKSERKSVRYRQFWEVSGKSLPFADSSESKKGFPLAPLFTHEIAHSLGMNHTDEWPAAKGMLSSMQSHLRTISPFDLAFLKFHYGVESGVNADIQKSDLTVSHLVRYNNGTQETKDYSNYNFATDNENSLKRINPVYLYSDQGRWLDCRTGKDPRFHVNWFNNGLKMISSQQRVNAEFQARTFSIRGPVTQNLLRFEIGEMEGLSQSYYSTQLTIRDQDLSTLSRVLKSKAEILFILDPDHSLSEANEQNNQISLEVELLPDAQACQASTIQAVTRNYLKNDGAVRGY